MSLNGEKLCVETDHVWVHDKGESVMFWSLPISERNQKKDLFSSGPSCSYSIKRYEDHNLGCSAVTMNGLVTYHWPINSRLDALKFDRLFILSFIEPIVCAFGEAKLWDSYQELPALVISVTNHLNPEYTGDSIYKSLVKYLPERWAVSKVVPNPYHKFNGGVCSVTRVFTEKQLRSAWESETSYIRLREPLIVTGKPHH